MPEALTGNVLDGKILSVRLNKALKRRAAELPRPPGLAVLLVGSDPASTVYVRLKGKVATRLGFHHVQLNLPATVLQADLLAQIDALNADPTVDGILVQLPLPDPLDAAVVMARIDPDKDVDGLSPVNAGLLSLGRPKFVPCTPLGVMRLLQFADIPISGARAVVVGRSNIVGRPLSRLLEQANATVTLCHSRTRDLVTHLGAADIAILAVGHPEMIHGDLLRPGAVVIDVGVNQVPEGGLVGDVHFPSASRVASLITPVPRGVGPMTIAMLMENTWRAACWHQGVEPTQTGIDGL